MISLQITKKNDLRQPPDLRGVLISLFPAVFIIVVFFFGGLFYGVLQSMGYLPSAGMTDIHLTHFINVLSDPDFFESLRLTFYVSGVSTAIAAFFGFIMALMLSRVNSRFIHFVFQLPLIVPHLVIAVAAIFLLTPTGFISRVLMKTGIIASSSDFPLLVNDEWCIGIIFVYIWKEIPFITLMILTALKKGVGELEMVGKTLKANRFQRLRFIIFPIVFPSMAAACLIVFAFTFGAFEVPFLLGRTYPLTLPVLAYKYFSDVDLLSRPEGIATGVVIAFVVIFSAVISHWLLLMRTGKGRGR